MHATIAAIARLQEAFDRDSRQANCPLNQLKLTWGGISQNTTVHLERPEFFNTLGSDDYGNENMQTKERSTT